MKIISGYLWAWRNYESGYKSLKKLREFYPEADIFINVDYEGDIENYEKISNEIGGTFSRNNFQIGYCGDHGAAIVKRDSWSRESTFEWIRGIYDACLKTESIYMILLEEDDFILQPISLLEYEFDMAIHPTDPSPIGWHRANFIPLEFKKYIQQNNGNPNSPGYASGGGTIFNRLSFIKAWEENKNKIWEDYDMLKDINKIIGWADYILQFIMQLEGYVIIQNNNLCEEWEVKDKWKNFEIVTGLKNMDEIKNL
jgi:hypothetical protein